MQWSEILILIAYAVFTSIPVFVAIKRKCKDIALINLLSSFLSWTVIGWIAALLWAMKGQTDESVTAI